MTTRVAVVTIMFGDRWKFLSQVVTAIMRDSHVVTMVIVDNGSKNSEEISRGVEQYGDRIVVLKQKKNLGSAGGFAVGLSYVRTVDCDFVFILDDDSVPEDDAIEQFLEIRKLFPNKKVVISGNRLDIPGNSDFFYQPIIKNTTAKQTFFDVLSFSKIKHFLYLALFKKNKNTRKRPFVPIVPNESFVYGGAFIPIEAVREAPLPDKSLFLYGDDMEYSWGIKKLGYDSYVCSSPKIHDLDLTFGGSPLFGIFDPKTTQLFKIYFRIRNMVLLSVRHSYQSKSVLFLNIVVWVIGLFILGLLKFGLTKVFFYRVKLILQAVRGGYYPQYGPPKGAELP